MLESKLEDGVYKHSILKAKHKRVLKYFVRKSGLDWIYDNRTPKIDYNSPYNWIPKGNMKERNFEIWLAEIRKNMVEMPERIKKYWVD